MIPLVTHDPSPNDVMLSAAEESDLFRHADALSLLKAGRLVIIVQGR